MIQDCREFHSRPVHRESRCKVTPLLRVLTVIIVGCLCAACATASAQYGDVPASDPGYDEYCPPTSEYGGADFFSQDLGSLVRIRYNTQSYGQDQRGNLDIGTMRVVNFEDAITFFDGQVTLNDVSGVGFNTGVGFRWMGWVPFPLEPERITGFSIWADGTSTEEGHFFPQVGLSYESLGDIWDFRANAYIPLGTERQTGEFVPTGEIGFNGNNLVDLTIADRFSSFNTGELEFARRLGMDRDAWAFVGPYVLANDNDDTAGYRVGVRGYAYPDLLLQLAVSDDDIFATKAAFSITWFIGRTRTDYQPSCGLPDRMREPVMRNDYVVLAKDSVTGGVALTDTNGDAFRFVHVDSDAPNGGNGTYEMPLNNVGEVNANSEDGDIILLYSDSVFPGQNALVMQDNQQLLGEGDDMTFQITTQQEGTIDIPETSPGAQAGAKPIILNALGDAVRLADANEVANLEIDGGQRGIVAGSNGAGNPLLHDLMIHDTMSDGIVLTPFVRVDADDPDLKTVAFNVTIDEVMFENIGGTELNINADTTEDVTDPDVTLLETIVVSNVTSTDGNNRGLLLQNTHSTGTFTLGNYTNGLDGVAGSGGGDTTDGVLRFFSLAGDVALFNVDIMNNIGYAFDFDTVDTTTAVTINGSSFWDGAAGDAGGMNFTAFDGTLTANNTTLRNGTRSGVLIDGDSDGTFTFADTVMFESIDGTAFDVNGFTGTLTVNSEFTNDAARSVSIQEVSMAGTSLTFNGDITDSGFSTGMLVQNNSDGTILFTGDLMFDLTNQTAVRLFMNTGADINFTGLVDIDTDGVGQFAFNATDGGTLTVSNTNNVIDTTGATGLQITDMIISNAGVNFGSFDVAGAPNGAVLIDNTGGPILLGTLGDPAGDSGTIAGVAGDAIIIDNSANVTVSSLQIDTTAGQSALLVNKENTGTQTVNLNDLILNNGAIGVEVTGNGTGALNMTVNDTMINEPTAFGLSFTSIDAGTIQINDVTIDGDPANADAVGVNIVDSNANFTFNSGTMIMEFDGTAFEISGGAGTVNMQGDITNAAGQSIHIHDVTGGTKTFSSTSALNDDGLGILAKDNTGGIFNFLGTYDIDTLATASEAVFLDHNPGASFTFAGLNILTAVDSDTRGFVAKDEGTVSVTGTTNVIDTDNGAGLVLDDMMIGAVDFQSVTVDGGAGPANAIFLRDLTNGQVAIGNTSGAQNSGGQLRSTSDAIVISDVQNVDLRHIRVIDSGGIGVNVDHTNSSTTTMDVTVNDLNLDASTNAGIDVLAASSSNNFNMRILNSDLEKNVTMSNTGSNTFALLVDNNDITTGAGTDIAFSLGFSGSATDGDLTFRNGNNFSADNASALSITSSGTTAKTVQLFIDGTSIQNTFSNDSGVVGRATANFLSGGNTLYQATIQGNNFANTDAGGSDFDMTAMGASARMRLNLGGDEAEEKNTAGGVGDFNLIEVPGADFDVFELDDTFNNLRNNGTVVPDPNAAAFEPLPTPPPIPPVP